MCKIKILFQTHSYSVWDFNYGFIMTVSHYKSYSKGVWQSRRRLSISFCRSFSKIVIRSLMVLVVFCFWRIENLYFYWDRIYQTLNHYFISFLKCHRGLSLDQWEHIPDVNFMSSLFLNIGMIFIYLLNLNV